MTLAIFHKLLAIFLTVALGWLAGRQRWLGGPGGSGHAARALSDAAFYLFVPALLFRTMVRLDFAALPWRTLAAYFVPVLAYLLAVYAGSAARRRRPRGAGARTGHARHRGDLRQRGAAGHPPGRGAVRRSRAGACTSRSSACTAWCC